MTISSLPYSSSVAGSLCDLYETYTIFLDQHKQTAASVAESLFYNLARPVSDRLEDLLRSIHRIAFNKFHFLQTAFTAVNALLAVYSAREIVLALSHPLVQASCKTFFGAGLPAITFALVLISANGWILSKTMGSHKSKTQILSGAVQLTGVIQSLALAALTENKISLLIRATMNGYNFYKNSKLNWLTIQESRKINHTSSTFLPRPSLSGPRSIIEQIDVSYSALLLSKSSQNDKCAICMDKGEAPVDQVFCTNSHTFHRACLEDYLNTCKDRFYHANRYIRNTTEYYRNGFHAGTAHSYNVDIDEAQLPKCPNCRGNPPHNHFDFRIHDDQGTFKATVNIQKTNPKNPQSIFEKIYAIYNGFQGILGTLQQIPEFTGGVTMLRRLMIVTDVAMGTLANYYLFKNLDVKEKNWYLRMAPITLAAIPLFLGLERLFQPKENLSQFNLNKVTARWERPLFEQVHRTLDVSRFLTTLGLTYFSKSHKIFNITSLVSQAIGLVGAMNVRWLRVDQSNLGKIGAEFNTYAILPSTLSKTTEAIKNAINYIANLQKDIVNKGELSIVNHYHDGFLTHQTLKITYTMEKIQNFGEYLFKPFIWTWDSLSVIGKARYDFRQMDLSVNLLKST